MRFISRFKYGFYGLIVGFFIVSIFIIFSTKGLIHDTPRDLLIKCSSNTVWDCGFVDEGEVFTGVCGCTSIEQGFRITILPALPLFFILYMFMFYVNGLMELLMVILSYIILGIIVGIFVNFYKSFKIKK
jgi:glucose-6-phosphate-specific signal transduction histidine kinase